MADLKISALPASTTPLAGTEVLPIVQSGTTVKVSVANLTLGRAITASNITDSGLTSGRVTYATTGGLLTDSANLQFDGTNLGLGVTPSAWGSSYKAIDLNTYGAITSSTSELRIWANAYQGASSYIYKTTSAATLYDMSGGAYRWYNAPSGTAGNAITFTTAMTLDNSGNLLVGCTTTGPSTSTGARILATGYISSTLSGSTNATDTLDVYSTGASAYRFYVDMAGTVHATSIVITAISDERLKENIRDLDTGLSTVMALKPRRFDWKESKGQDKKNAAGFIAQEFQEVLPNSISTFKAGEDGIDYLTMNHEELIPTLVKAIQELKAEVDSLKQQLNGA